MLLRPAADSRGRLDVTDEQSIAHALQACALHPDSHGGGCGTPLGTLPTQCSSRRGQYRPMRSRRFTWNVVRLMLTLAPGTPARPTTWGIQKVSERHPRAYPRCRRRRGEEVSRGTWWGWTLSVQLPSTDLSAHAVRPQNPAPGAPNAWRARKCPRVGRRASAAARRPDRARGTESRPPAHSARRTAHSRLLRTWMSKTRRRFTWNLVRPHVEHRAEPPTGTGPWGQRAPNVAHGAPLSRSRGPGGRCTSRGTGTCLALDRCVQSRGSRRRPHQGAQVRAAWERGPAPAAPAARRRATPANRGASPWCESRMRQIHRRRIGGPTDDGHADDRNSADDPALPLIVDRRSSCRGSPSRSPSGVGDRARSASDGGGPQALPASSNTSRRARLERPRHSVTPASQQVRLQLLVGSTTDR